MSTLRLRHHAADSHFAAVHVRLVEHWLEASAPSGIVSRTRPAPADDPDVLVLHVDEPGALIQREPPLVGDRPTILVEVPGRVELAGFGRSSVPVAAEGPRPAHLARLARELGDRLVGLVVGSSAGAEAAELAGCSHVVTRTRGGAGGDGDGNDADPAGDGFVLACGPIDAATGSEVVVQAAHLLRWVHDVPISAVVAGRLVAADVRDALTITMRALRVDGGSVVADPSPEQLAALAAGATLLVGAGATGTADVIALAVIADVPVLLRDATHRIDRAGAWWVSSGRSPSLLAEAMSAAATRGPVRMAMAARRRATAAATRASAAAIAALASEAGVVA